MKTPLGAKAQRLELQGGFGKASSEEGPCDLGIENESEFAREKREKPFPAEKTPPKCRAGKSPLPKFLRFTTTKMEFVKSISNPAPY